MSPRRFLVPIALTYTLLAWWIFALVHPVNVGTTAQGPGGQSDAAWLNFVLMLIVASAWGLTSWIQNGPGEKR